MLLQENNCRLGDFDHEKVGKLINFKYDIFTDNDRCLSVIVRRLYNCIEEDSV